MLQLHSRSPLQLGQGHIRSYEKNLTCTMVPSEENCKVDLIIVFRNSGDTETELLPSNSIYNRCFTVDGFFSFFFFLFLAPKSLSPCKQGRRERKGSRRNPRCLFNVVLGKTMICGPRPSSSSSFSSSERNTCFVWFETASATHGARLLVCFGILYVFSLALAAPTSSLLRRNFLGHK